jgi:hypothetical protein
MAMMCILGESVMSCVGFSKGYESQASIFNLLFIPQAAAAAAPTANNARCFTLD